jgi:hypothetical protein
MPRAPSGGSPPRSQIKISLAHSKPLIWRRVLIPADLPLDWLHAVIQIVMGWHDCHLHHFFSGTGRKAIRYAMASPETDGAFPEDLCDGRLHG